MSLDIFRITPEPPESLTAHIRVLSDDRIPSRSHELLDARVLEKLDKEEHRHLKDPKAREDYIGLVELVAITVKSFEDLGTVKYAMKKIKAEYNSDNTSEEKWRDFKRLIDSCLTKRKFRMIRCLHEFWLGWPHKELRWSQITEYNGSLEQFLAEEAEMAQMQETANLNG